MMDSNYQHWHETLLQHLYARRYFYVIYIVQGNHPPPIQQSLVSGRAQWVSWLRFKRYASAFVSVHVVGFLLGWLGMIASSNIFTRGFNLRGGFLATFGLQVLGGILVAGEYRTVQYTYNTREAANWEMDEILIIM